MKAFIFLPVLIALTLNISHAQDDRKDRFGFGMGPSMLYGDNSGIRKKLKFKVLPAFSVDYSKKINTFFDVKATVGFQMINSGDFYHEGYKIKVAEANLPHAFKGNLIYGDIMPVYHINPNQSGYLPAMIKVYTGLGLGYFSSIREDVRRIYSETGFTEETYSASNAGMYIPYRLGIYKELENGNGEIALEGSMLISMGAQMDGNDLPIKTIKSDIAMQLQFYYRIYLGR